MPMRLGEPALLFHVGDEFQGGVFRGEGEEERARPSAPRSDRRPSSGPSSTSVGPATETGSGRGMIMS